MTLQKGKADAPSKASTPKTITRKAGRGSRSINKPTAPRAISLTRLRTAAEAKNRVKDNKPRVNRDNSVVSRRRVQADTQGTYSGEVLGLDRNWLDVEFSKPKHVWTPQELTFSAGVIYTFVVVLIGFLAGRLS